MLFCRVVLDYTGKEIGLPVCVRLGSKTISVPLCIIDLAECVMFECLGLS